MQYHRAYYSIIQYCPDRSRAEAANIGVLLLCPDLGFVDARLSTNNARVRKFFGIDSFDAERLRVIERSIRDQIREKYDWSEGLADLERFIGTRANDIQLTPARPMKTANPEVDLDRLFAELVEAPRERAEEAAADGRNPLVPRVFQELDAKLKQPGIRERIRFGEVVDVPLVEKKLSIPYSYQNGVLNLVKPHEFKGSASQVTKSASALAVQGELLKRQPMGQPRQLIVLPAFAPGADRVSGRVEKLLRTFEVEVVSEDGLDEFISRIAQTAHL